MKNLFLTVAVQFNGYQPDSLDIIALLSILVAIFVITARNPIVSVLFLIGLFLSIACYLILIGIHFIGLAYLLIYIGGVSILLLFSIMLINIRISELHVNTNNSVLLGLIFSISLYYPLFRVIPFPKNEVIDPEFNTIFLTSSNKWDTEIAQNSDISSIGNILYSSHAIWLILVSIILLLTMVGAITLTVNTKRG